MKTLDNPGAHDGRNVLSLPSHPIPEPAAQLGACSARASLQFATENNCSPCVSLFQGFEKGKLHVATFVMVPPSFPRPAPPSKHRDVG
eukprot:1161864-Pelagomonas_calceolata.AAC.27